MTLKKTTTSVRSKMRIILILFVITVALGALSGGLFGYTEEVKK
jgi:hypothetical protein